VYLYISVLVVPVSMAKTVVILGAGWAGLPLAHKLLKYSLPKAKDGLKVFLVSPSSHFHWNLAAVRGVIPGATPDDQLFLPVEPGFAKYSAENFEFVPGKAERLDPERNTIELARNDGTHALSPTINSSSLPAPRSAATCPSNPSAHTKRTLTALHSLQKQIDVAKSIVVAGAGPTGVETAGELAAAYGGQKDIMLIIGGGRALEASHVMPSVAQAVERDLQKLGVKLVRNTKVKGVQTTAKGEEDAAAQTTLTLSNGSTLVADLYLPLFGIQVNTSFVPESLLDSAGNLVLDKTMRVVGTNNVWGIGDVGNVEGKQVTVTDAQIIHLSAALDSILTGEGGQVKEYTPTKRMMIFITMGKKHATGQMFGWRLWG